MDHNIFISHESSSLPYVETLAKMFEDNGVSCWYAPRDLDNSGAGKEYDDEIVEAIHTASAIVVILTDEALQSLWVKREVNQAEKQGKMIFPYVISELTINNGLLMRLEDKHLINAYPNPTIKEPLLLKNVKLHLKQDVSGIHISESVTRESASKKKINDAVDLDYEEGIVLYEAEESKDAFLAFLKAAERDNKEAQTYLYKILFQHCRETEFLDDETWNHIEELSDSNIGFADLLMHYRYYGMGTQDEIALKYLKRAIAKQVSPYVYLQMGICYGWGLGVDVKKTLEMHYYKKAYEEGCIAAASYIGQLYRFGGLKIPKDYEKSEAILKEGINKGDLRSWGQLLFLYYDSAQLEKAKDLLDEMIKRGIKGAYSKMGDYFYYSGPEDQRDIQKAEDWYQKAINHNEKSAWGALAILYWNMGDTSGAFRMAQKGYDESDSDSIWVLGWLYENDNDNCDYSKAWDCYMKQVTLFGNSAVSLADLYINHDFLPEGYPLSQLKHLLKVDIKRDTSSSLICLIKIILKERGKTILLDYDTLHDIPEIYEYLEDATMFVERNDDLNKLRYIYGRLLLDKKSKIYNPYRAYEVLNNEAANGNEAAIMILLDVYKEKGDKDKLKDLTYGLIMNQQYPSKHINTILSNVSERVDQQTFDKWISGAIAALSEEDKAGRNILEICQLYKARLTKNFKEGKETPDEEIQAIQDLLARHKSEIEMTGCMSLLREHAYLIHPNYDSEDILKGDFFLDEDFQLLFHYSMNTYRDVHVLTPETLEERFFTIIMNHIEDGYKHQACYRKYAEFYKAYCNMVEAFQNIKDQTIVCPIEEDVVPDEKRFKPYCSVSDALYYAKLGLKMLIAAQNTYGDQWEAIKEGFGDDNAILDAAEKMDNNPNAQFLVVSYVEILIELEALCIEMNAIRTAIVKKDKAALVKEYSEWAEFLESEHIPNTLPLYTEDTLPKELFE